MVIRGMMNKGGREDPMKEATRILIVEDDYEIARVMSDQLKTNGYDVTWASTGQEGWEDFKEITYDLAIVDLMLPEMDGFQLCEKIRMESDVPLLIVSAKQEDDAKIKGLDLGADDYLTKPFSLKELIARVQSHLRRYHRYLNIQENAKRIHYKNDLLVDFSTKAVYLEDKLINFTQKEQEIFFLLAKNPFLTFEKSKLYEHIWQQMDVDGNNTVTVHIRSIRQKLLDTQRETKFIQTVWGLGYRFIGEEV